MNRKITIASILITITIFLVVIALRRSEYPNRGDIAILEIIRLAKIKDALLEKTSVENPKELSGTYSNVPFGFVKGLTSKMVSGRGKYIIVVGAEPVEIGSRGSLVCITPKDEDVVYLCEVRNKDFDAFSTTPPFTFREVKIEEMNPRGNK